MVLHLPNILTVIYSRFNTVNCPSIYSSKISFPNPHISLTQDFILYLGEKEEGYCYRYCWRKSPRIICNDICTLFSSGKKYTFISISAINGRDCRKSYRRTQRNGNKMTFLLLAQITSQRNPTLCYPQRGENPHTRAHKTD